MVAFLLMGLSKLQLWEKFQKYYIDVSSVGLTMDISRMDFTDDFLARMEPGMQKAFAEMVELENGAIANKDENRMVGHYWLRNPALSPTPEIRQEIEQTVASIKDFAAKVHSGAIRGTSGLFKNLLVIGIGGSALGPQFVSNALGHAKSDKLKVFFFDNTDPDGFDNTLSQIGDLATTLCVVISKSGGTKETRNGMLEAKAAYETAGLVFGNHCVAVTGKGSELDRYAAENRWLLRFPMWDWVGGRTSQLSAVGLLPASLQGIDIDSLLSGARACDEATRRKTTLENPAALLALMWHYAGQGRGTKNMVVLPYKDRLELFSKYLQQLVMESLGKERDRGGALVNQGITVLGNKGSTDQHSYVQQLREGLKNFFVVFIEVLKDRTGKSLLVEPGTTSGDYLLGFLLGTRQALYENGRESVTITVSEVSGFSIGALIALFERSVGLYASLVNVNAYHQPGVEAGKKAATTILELESRVMSALSVNPTTADEIAKSIGTPEDAETVFEICSHLAANTDRNVAMDVAAKPGAVRFRHMDRPLPQG
jgi:glucose-6-phosphate isomerase